jgi:hypothetical protein
MNYRISAQLIDSRTAEPLPQLTVRGADLQSRPPTNIGTKTTSATGRFTFTFTVPDSADPEDEETGGASRRIRLHISTPRGTQVHRTEISVRPNQRSLKIKVPTPETSDRTSPTLQSLAKQLHITIPSNVLNALAKHNVRTLDDLRKAGGVAHIHEPPPIPKHPVVPILEAHARLSALSLDLQTSAKLIDRGFHSILAIAQMPRPSFLRKVQGALDTASAAQLHAAARAQTSFLSNVLVGLQADWANRFPLMVSGLTNPHVPDFFPVVCSCKDCEAALSPGAYLADLLAYTVGHITHTESGEPITLSFLRSTFHQPFDDLPASCKSMEAKIRQVRMAVEVLRGYLGARPLAYQAKETALLTAEQDYGLTVYTALLARLGTSWQELRLARTADGPSRLAIAERMGIAVEHLNALILDPTAVTEPALMELFGFVDTNQRPLLPQPTASLLTWRLDRLRAMWRDEDWPGGTAGTGAPAIDPSVIGLEYVKKYALNDPAYRLWHDRERWLETRLNDLRAAARTLEGLDGLLPATLGVAAADLANLETQRQQGQDISARIEELGLHIGAFPYLLRVRALIQAQAPVTGAEWEDVFVILLHAQKRREMFAVWRAEERDNGVLLGPDYFKIPAASLAAFPAAEQLDSWRDTAESLRNWKNKLQARIDVEQTIIQALTQAVSEVEEITLPALRDALVLASDAAGEDLSSKSDWITRRLLIDAKEGGCRQTTRVAQAIETLQGIFTAYDVGRFEQTFPGLSLAADHLEEEWQWLGSYATWRAAMFVCLYPESLLHPSLRRRQSSGFVRLTSDLRSNRRLTPEDACRVARVYSDYFRDVCSLTPEASCYANTLMHSGACRGRVSENRRRLFYVFARSGATNNVYWSTYDAQDESGYAQSFWASVPGLVNVLEIVGAAPYWISATERFIFLFARRRIKGQNEVIFTRFNLETQKWDEAVSEPLEMPEKASQFDVAVANQGAARRPRLAIRIPDGRIYSRALSSDGAGWEEWQFKLVRREDGFYQSVPEKMHLCAMFHLGGTESFLLFVRTEDESEDSEEGLLFYAKVSRALQNYNQELELWEWSFEELPGVGSHLSWAELGEAGAKKKWLGAFRWYGSNEFFVYWRRGDDIECRVLDLSTGETRELENPFPGLESIAKDGGGSSGATTKSVAYKCAPTAGGEYRDGPYRSALRRDEDALTEISFVRIAPSVGEPFDLVEQLRGTQVQDRKELIEAAFTTNDAGPPSNLVYLHEAWYFVPIQLALALQERTEYAAALNYFRTVYDYGAHPGGRKIYYGLTLEESLQNVFARSADWLQDPLNPHQIAETRGNTYTRYTLLSIIRCLLDFGNAEFSRDTAESAPRARDLYMTALDLLASDELRQEREDCDDLIGGLVIDVPDARGGRAWEELRNGLYGIENLSDLREVIHGIGAIMAGAQPIELQLAGAQELIGAHAGERAAPRFDEVVVRKAAGDSAQLN